MASRTSVRFGALKPIGVVAWSAGIAACIALSAVSGLDDVANGVAGVGWGTSLVVLTRATTVCIAGAGWWLLFPVSRPLRLRATLLLRFVREGVNTLLPLTQVGGDIIGARLLTFWAGPGPLRAGATILGFLMPAATEFPFAARGRALLISLGL